MKNSKIDWKEALDCTDDVMFLTDLNGYIQQCNKKLIEMTGMDKEQILGEKWENLFLKTGFNEELHEPNHIEIVHDSEERFHLNLRPVKSSDNVEYGYIIYMHNVTKLRRAREKFQETNQKLKEAYIKLRKAWLHILQQEKMASIGQLAAGIAHEINNPIAYVISNLNSLAAYTDKIIKFLNEQLKVIEKITGFDIDECNKMINGINEKKHKYKIDFILEDIKSLVQESVIGSNKIKKIVQDLKDFSYIDQEQYKPADLNKGLDNTINILRNELKHKVILKKDYKNIPLTNCNPGQLNQVFMNIILNAVQSIKDKGEIIVKTRHIKSDIIISISDTGCGIKKNDLNRLFEPFFSTKDVGSGTGLGLSTSFEIVKNHNGEINVKSEVDKGTMFIIKIPVISKEDL